MSSGKATGPDLIPADRLKLLTDPQLRSMADFLATVFQTAQTPEQWDHSTAVGIYQGNRPLTDPSTYRPITLLNTTYKLFARLIHIRMAKGLDSKLRPTQFGFRANRSTSQPLFALHRLLEMATQKDKALYHIFLDWKKAFDSISHEGLRSALVIMGVPPKYVNVVDAIYSDPRFTARTNNESK